MVFDKKIEGLQLRIEDTKDQYARARPKSVKEELYYQKFELLNKELVDIQKKKRR